jgi:hypothetical protein
VRLVVAAASVLLFAVPIAAAADFGRPAEIPLARAPAAVAVQDATEDSYVDLVVLNRSAPGISVLAGRGDGSFERAVDVQTGTAGGARAIAFDDFDADGAQDAVVAAGNALVIFTTSDGRLVRKSSIPANAPSAVAATDLNSDGTGDIVATSGKSAVVDVLLGREDGAFDVTELPIGGVALSLAIQDLNGDEVSDVAVAGSGISLLFGLGDGTFEPYRSVTMPVPLRSIAAGYLDADSSADLAVAGGPNRAFVLMNQGDGTFSEPASYRVGGTPSAIQLVDTDSDGYDDLVTANRGSNDISVLHGDEVGVFGPQVRVRVGQIPTSIAAGDFNQDGADDLAVSSQRARSVTVLLQAAAAPVPSICLVPRVVKRKLAVARRLVSGRGCTTGTVRRRYSRRVVRGKVLAQSPSPGTRLPEDSRVALVVSRGPRR